MVHIQYNNHLTAKYRKKDLATNRFSLMSYLKDHADTILDFMVTHIVGFHGTTK